MTYFVLKQFFTKMKSNKNTACSVRLEIYVTGRYALRELLETPCYTHLHA